MMRKLWTVLLSVLLLAAACSGGGGKDAVTLPGDDVAKADVVAEVAATETMAPEIAPVPDVPVQPDLSLEIEQEMPSRQCAEGEGCFLDQCTENNQCQSGWCVEHMSEGVCSRFCQDECPAGWSCQQVAGTFPDLVYVCASEYSNLCKPCADGSDCKSVGGMDDVCVDYGEAGSFCGGACIDDQECPWGFTCQQATTVDGLETSQCVADAGVCPCTTKSVALSLWTPCSAANEFGVCDGKRVCGEEGLSDCDALVPIEESCSGLDDDCDGQTDEPHDVDGTYVNLCDDGNDCTQDQCKGESGCDYVPLEGVECMDGNICTVADHCQQGVCEGDPVICDDDNPCTDNECTETGGCEYPANNEQCDDGDPCTLGDECKLGECVGVSVDCDCFADQDCAMLEDGDVCNGTLYCDMGSLPHQCKVDSETVVECPAPQGADAICLQAACDSNNGECSLVPANDGFPCENGDLCNLADTCADGVCMGGPKVNCNDGNLCTDDSCAPDSGCTHQPSSAACDDGDVCTKADYCAGGECQPGLVLQPCDDGNICTDDSCEPLSGCAHVANNAACDDGNACTDNDYCEGGQCTFGSIAKCDDGNPCTDDACKPAEGCSYALNEAQCDDDDPCTVGDHCSSGLCIPKGLVECDDGNPCTADLCQIGVGCTASPKAGACTDGNACTDGDYCSEGACKPGSLVACDDENECTTDYCDPAAGECVYAINSLPCNDDDLCTTDDFCHLGACTGVGNLLCDDGNDCTEDSCQPPVGCVFTQTQIPCCVGGTQACGDVCANWQVDPQHCGGCNKACDAGEVCSKGECQATCGQGQLVCGGVCTNTAFDPSNCGECLKECPGADNANGICVGGDCKVLCDGAYEDCNLNMGDGCEVDLMTDPKHCGFCGDLCPPVDNGQAGCADGDCLIEECNGTFENCDGQFDNGCEADLWTNPNNCGQCDKKCGQGFVCKDGDCVEQATSFIVHNTKDIVYKGVNYLLLKVSLATNVAQSDNWCFEYRNLCQSYGLAPTGCGDSWPNSWYKECKTIYGSITYDSSLSCNPSSQVADAASQAGFGGANAQNSFGFHYCQPTACVKTLCSGTNCNNALTYFDAGKPFGYTLCIK